MAINYSYAEMVKVLADGKDVEAVQDIMKRYPMAAYDALQVIALAGERFVSLAQAIPEHMSASKVNKESRDLMDTPEVAEEAQEEKPVAEEKVVEKVAEKPEPKKAAEPAKRRGRPPKKVVEEKPVTIEEVMDEELEDEEFDDGVTDEYSNKTPIELFKMCKARGIKVPAKQTVELYASKLREDDLKQEDDDDEDDDWDI